MTLAAPPRRFVPAAPVRPHAVVIGAGFGGLAAAVRLLARGYRVTVFEALEQAGGRAAVFRQDGFTFDAGPTIVTAPFLFEELWRLAGKRMADDVTLVPMDPFYRLRFHDGTIFEASADAAAVKAQIARLSPADVAGYDRFMRASEAIFRVGFEQLGHVPFHSLGAMAKVAPKFVTLQSWRSVYGLVSRYFKDPRLRVAFSFHPLFIGGSPFTATSVYCLISYLEKQWGVHFALGGTGALVRGLVELVEGQGGLIRCGTKVAAITAEGRRATGVRLASGEVVAADVVVSNADSAATYRNLLPAAHRRRWTDRKLDRARYSMSLFVWYFGTRRRYDDVAHHTILLGPRYRGLIDDIFRRKVLAADHSLYLHRPTATDGALAPPGCDAFYVLSPVPNLQGDIDWTAAAEPYRLSIQRTLTDTILPGLPGAVVTSRVITPLDFRDRLSSLHGAAFGLEPLFTQSAWFRPHNRSEELDRLYLVGAGTHPGAGLPGVLSSARVLDQVVPDAAALA